MIAGHLVSRSPAGAHRPAPGGGPLTPVPNDFSRDHQFAGCQDSGSSAKALRAVRRRVHDWPTPDHEIRGDSGAERP